MLYKKWILFSILCTFLWADNTIINSKIDMRYLNGAWLLRALDGMEVRKARAILDFDIQKMKLNGFDACNRISGTLKHTNNNTHVPRLRSTRMACRQHIHRWVSKRLHETLKEGFSIIKETKYGVEGIIIKSPNHELFLKRMQRD